MMRYGMSVILCTFMILVAGCSGTTPENPGVSEDGQFFPPELNAKLETLGKAFESGYKTDPGSVIDRYINTSEISSVIKSNPVYRNFSIKDSKYLEQKLSSPEINKELQKDFATQSDGVDFSYSGTVRDGKKAGIVMRSENTKGDIDYWILYYSVQGNEVTPQGVYIATVGGSYNEYVAGTMIERLMGSPGFVARLTGKTGDELKKKLEIVGRMGTAIKTGKINQAIEIYEKEESGKYKYLPLDLLYLRALRTHDANIPDSELKPQTEKAEKAVATIKAYKPDYIAGDLFLTERYIAMQDVEKGKATLKELRTKLGSDAHLDYLEGSLYLSGNPENAMSLYKSAGRKGLRSRAYLLAYYSLMKKTPGTSEAAAEKIVEAGTKLYGPTFKQEIAKIRPKRK